MSRHQRLPTRKSNNNYMSPSRLQTILFSNCIWFDESNMINLIFSTVLVGVALSILLVLVGIVIYQKGLIQNLFLQRSKRICRTARRRNKKVAATKSLFGSFENNTHLTISSHNLPCNNYENDKLSYADETKKQTSKNSFREGNDLSQTKKPKLSIPRHDSVLISAFEVEHIRQIQNFLLFPILNPLSDNSQPTPEIWQVIFG